MIMVAIAAAGEPPYNGRRRRRLVRGPVEPVNDQNSPLIRLHPAPHEAVELRGLYLRAPLEPESTAAPFVYSNFVTSLDGRIALLDAPAGRYTVPDSIANARDWRLFQELAARADLLLTSGRYLRDYASGCAQDSLLVSTRADFADLLDWRRSADLKPQPDVAILSGSLDFDLPADWLGHGRRVLVLTGGAAPEERIRGLQSAGADVVRLGGGGLVEGSSAINFLGAAGYRRIYSVGGPYVLHTLLRDGLLDSLFLTTVHRLVGESDAPGFLEGARLPEIVDLRLRWLYLDPPNAPGALGQSLARYDRAR